MSKSTRFVWLDDEPDRAPTALDIDSEFIDLSKNLPGEVEKFLAGPQPPLVILDHILNKTAGSNQLFKRGSTIAEAIKEQWPDCPVVCVTNAEPRIDARTKRAYDELFPFVRFGDHIPRLKSISHGFEAVGRAKPKKARDLIKLLHPPDDEIDRLESALPEDLRSRAEDASVASRFFDWINHIIDRPGFLLDALWSATAAGLNELGFKQVNGQFRAALYTGVFARPDQPRWWSSRLVELLYRKCTPQTGEFSWHVGRRLPGVQKKHFSACYRCKDEYPEIVAFLDEESAERRAMHLKCTEPDLRYKRELYFEDIRVMLGT